MTVTRLDVFYRDDGEPRLVGGLAMDRRGVVHFQYSADWIAAGIELSPIQLPLDAGAAVVAAPRTRELHDLHGVFADSLPDAWGLRLLDSAMRRAGLDPLRAGPLDRLWWVGDDAMGALSYRPAHSRRDAADDGAVALESLADQAEALYAANDVAADAAPEESSAALAALERAAGSAGGGTPKALVFLGEDGKHAYAGSATGAAHRAHLVKFTPRRPHLGLRTDAGVLEEAYARMCRAAGITLPPTRLVATADGRLHFAVERFDRTASGGRRHVHTLGGLLGRPAAAEGDYDELLRVARLLTGDARVLLEVIRRLYFNVAALNDDDHLKNTAFLLDPGRGWTLAPAYDVTYAPSRGGERGMSVAGLERGITRGAVLALADRHSLRAADVRAAMDAVDAAIDEWPMIAHAAGVPSKSVSEVAASIAARRASRWTKRRASPPSA